MKNDLATLRANVETIAREEERDPLEVVTALQAGAAAMGFDDLVSDLCEVKRALAGLDLDDSDLA
jgi:hypothetical protein